MTAQTPLELYENAYRLHYQEKKIADAVRIYEAIIRTFPDSNECGYSFFQLQKIKAAALGGEIKKTTQETNPLLIVAAVSGMLALVVALVGTLLISQEIRQERQRVNLAVTALGKMYAGDSEAALSVLDQMKSSSRQDILAFELSSAIYRKHDLLTRRQAPAPSTAKPQETTEPSAPPKPETRAAAQKRKVTPPPPRAKKKQKVIPAPSKEEPQSPLIVDPDSISYF